MRAGPEHVTVCRRFTREDEPGYLAAHDVSAAPHVGSKRPAILPTVSSLPLGRSAPKRARHSDVSDADTTSLAATTYDIPAATWQAVVCAAQWASALDATLSLHDTSSKMKRQTYQPMRAAAPADVAVLTAVQVLSRAVSHLLSNSPDTHLASLTSACHVCPICAAPAPLLFESVLDEAGGGVERVPREADAAGSLPRSALTWWQQAEHWMTQPLLHIIPPAHDIARVLRSMRFPGVAAKSFQCSADAGHAVMRDQLTLAVLQDLPSGIERSLTGV
ncbi:MAG: hypothetical protein EOO65_05610 [Methanosarcinales archaeon]|nr:MAG: hypothetical protein EOO65_05610 [Methanosarcinales archaeon]